MLRLRVYHVACMKTPAYETDVPVIDVWALFGGTWQKAAMFD